MTKTTRRHFSWRRLGAALLLFCALAAPADARQRDIAAPPGREVLTLHEAAHLMRVRASELERLAYDGWVGCEYVPATSAKEGLGWMKPYATED